MSAIVFAGVEKAIIIINTNSLSYEEGKRTLLTFAMSRAPASERESVAFDSTFG